MERLRWSARTPGSVLMLIAVFLLAACSGAATGGPADVSVATPGPQEAGPAGEAPDDGGGEEAGDEPPAAEAPDDAVIIRTGRLELEVTDLATVLTRARDVVAGLGGYVAASQEVDRGDDRTATITYRIPADRWQDALDGLRGLASRVVLEQTEAQEVTAQVVDIEARLANLRASEAALQTLMDRAGTIEDVLEVQERLTTTREQIERLVAQQQDLQDRAALATLTVSWQVPGVAVAEAGQGWDLGREIDLAAAQTVRLGQGLASALIWLVVVGIPLVVPLMVVGYLLFRLQRRWAAGRPPRTDPPRWGPTAAGHSG